MNKHHSIWFDFQAGVPQGSIIGPWFFLIYINDLSDDLTPNLKLFADDTSLFLYCSKYYLNNNQFNIDLSKISDWVFQKKMNFNPDPNKQALEVVFSGKVNKINHHSLLFDQNLFASSSFKIISEWY